MRKGGRQYPKPRKSHAESVLQEHYRLAANAAKAHNEKQLPQTKAAVDGIMRSALKHLHTLNAERAKHKLKPLTLEEVIELVRNSRE